MDEEEYEDIRKQTQQICDIVRDTLAKRGFVLYDIKLEFGRTNDGEVVLIDEISGGNMRVYKDGQYVQPLELTKMILNK